MVGWIPWIRFAYAPRDTYAPSDSENFAEGRWPVIALDTAGTLLLIVGVYTLWPLLVLGVLLWLAGGILYTRARRKYLSQHHGDPDSPAYARDGYADYGESDPSPSLPPNPPGGDG